MADFIETRAGSLDHGRLSIVLCCVWCACVFCERVCTLYVVSCMYMWRGVLALWCCGVVLVCCGVWCCGVVWCGCLWYLARLGARKNARADVQDARMLKTCVRFAGTHGGVLNLHTGGPLLFSRPYFFFPLSFLWFLSLPPLSSLLFHCTECFHLSTSLLPPSLHHPEKRYL